MQVLRVNNIKLQNLAKLFEVKNMVHDPIRFVNYRGRVIPLVPVNESKFKSQERRHRWNNEIQKMVKYFVVETCGDLGTFGLKYFGVAQILSGPIGDRGFNLVSAVGALGVIFYTSRFMISKIMLDYDNRIPVNLSEHNRKRLHETNIDPESFFIHDKKTWNSLAGENNQHLLHFAKILPSDNTQKKNDEKDYEIYDLH